MRAVVLRIFGEPKNLKVEEVPTPQPGPDEVLVEVHSAGINPSDVKNVAGGMHGTTLPRIPGRDFAGVVIRGPRELLGRQVWGTGGDIGFTRDGSHAQYLLLPAAAAIPKPAALSMDAAGSAGLTLLTAWIALVRAAVVAPADTVLVIGAVGGVGSAAVQIAKSRGARVIAAVRAESDIASARDGGADEVVLSSPNLGDSVRSLTQGRGADVAFDSTGMMFADAVDSAAMAGRVPVISAPADGTSTFNLRSIYRKELRIGGVDSRRVDVVASAAILAAMAPAIESGQIRPRPAQPRPLAEAVEAYQQSARGGARFSLQPQK